MATAVILAAGLGTRLHPLTGDRPKALVTVRGRTLLDGLLVTCASAGCRDALVVTGHFHDAITRRMKEGGLPLPVRCVHNEMYATRGNAWSLRVALAELGPRDVLKLDGDLILDDATAAGLLATPARSAIGIDPRAALDEEAMKARVSEEGRVLELGKGIETTRASGEAIGAEKIAAEDVPRVLAAIDRLMDASPMGYYEDAYQLLLTDGWDLRAFDVDSTKWIEIDTPEDLSRAERRAGDRMS